MSATLSATELMNRWVGGDATAAEPLYRRYAERLCQVANAHLSGRIRRRVGADDIVQSVFRTFFRRANAGQFAVDHSGALWKLLETITINKVRKQAEYHQAGKRAVDSEIRFDSDESHIRFTLEPNLEEAVALNDELEHLVRQLDDPEPRILQLRLEGLSTQEIAQALGCSRSTVRRSLKRIGFLLESRLKSES